MKTKLTNFFKTDGRQLALAFLIPFFLITFVYLLTGIYPGSSRSILASDAFSQFSNFHAAYRNMLLGKQGLFYTWNASLGLNFFALTSYYLGGLLTPLVIFFPNKYMPDALYFLTLIKIGLSGVSFWFYARRFKLRKPLPVAFAVSYALMSFICAHSELIMWLDSFIYLPLIILGIEKLQDEKKPLLLFVSYFLMFTTNFYFGFMVGLFSFLYFFARTFTNWHLYTKRILSYFVTSLLAGGASMLIILPTYLDLKTNGEALSSITKLKTEATAPFDLLMKNMIGVYDTTKYGSIPFVYIGLVPLIFCIFYFVTKKVPLKNKIAFGSLFVVIAASFYLVPLNLFWHGMHAPNMFLFRYSFTFSFLVIALALRSFRLVEKENYFTLSLITLTLTASFLLGKGFLGASYSYISIWSLVLTVIFLLVYGALWLGQGLNILNLRLLASVLLVVMAAEATINAGGMINGILQDWNYASRSLYTDTHDDIQQLVDDAKEETPTFFRLENLTSISSNDGFNFGYSGISMFSSIRNRNSSSMLDQLGFRSRGTNLNVRYNNNTLLMDALFGVAYNIHTDDPMKAGFTQVSVANNFELYHNENALPLGILTDSGIHDVVLPENDNLSSQQNLYNYLAQGSYNYFDFLTPEITETTNTKVTSSGGYVTYAEENPESAKDIHYRVTVPAGKQAYLSLYPANFNQLSSSTVTLAINGQSLKSQLNITGQYLNLGYYEEETTIDFVASFYGTENITFMDPVVVALDVASFSAASQQIQSQGVDFTTDHSSATAEVNLTQDQTLLTTIPYDLGWKAYLDGQEISVDSFKDAFITVDLPSGEHTLTFKFVPAGFKVGVLLTISSLLLFSLYLYYLKRRNAKFNRGPQ